MLEVYGYAQGVTVEAGHAFTETRRNFTRPMRTFNFMIQPCSWCHLM